jgi:hypothetical protein
MLSLRSLHHGYLLQLLDCAKEHSKGELKLDDADYKKISTTTAQKLSSKNGSGKKTNAPHENELAAFLSSVNEATRSLLICTIADKVSAYCKHRGCGTPITSRGPDDLQYLRYKGKEKYSSSEEFSRQVEFSLNKYVKCHSCHQENQIPNSFLQWPKYLFVCYPSPLAISSLKYAAAYAFTIGYSVKAKYSLIGAVVVKKQNRVALVLLDKWYACKETHEIVDVGNYKECCKVEHLLFARDEKLEHIAHSELTTTTTSTDVQEEASEARSTISVPHKTHQNKDLDHAQEKKSSLEPRNVLRLPNQGNSCWIAACCQLIYCAHVRSGQQAFCFDNTSLANPII